MLPEDPIDPSVVLEDRHRDSSSRVDMAGLDSSPILHSGTLVSLLLALHW